MEINPINMGRILTSDHITYTLWRLDPTRNILWEMDEFHYKNETLPAEEMGIHNT
jgi:pantothenate kinase